MKTQANPAPAPAPIFDAATVAAAAQMIEAKNLDKAIRSRPGLATSEAAGLYRFLGAPGRSLAYEFRRLRTDLSQSAPPPSASDEDVFAPGAVIAVGVGDHVPDPQFFEKLSDEESADVVTVQQALALRAVDRGVEAAAAGLGAADQVLHETTARVAEATRRREQASAARDVAARSSEREKARLSDHLAPYGDGGEEKLRAVLASFRRVPKPASVDGLRVNRGGGVMELIPVTS